MANNVDGTDPRECMIERRDSERDHRGIAGRWP